jgi:hypothetical protein
LPDSRLSTQGAQAGAEVWCVPTFIGQGTLGGRLQAAQVLEQALHLSGVHRRSPKAQGALDVRAQVGGVWIWRRLVIHTSLGYKYKCSPFLDIGQSGEYHEKK